VHQHGIHFDGDDFVRKPEEFFRQRAFSRTDFDDRSGRVGRTRRFGDALQNGFAGKKMLP
jgi:hypothetical protein